MTIKVPSKTQCGAWAKSMRCVSGCNAVTLSRHRIGFSEQIYCNGCRRYLKRATQYYCYGNWDLFYSRKSRQSRQKLRAIFREIREREIINLCVPRTLHADVPTLSLLTTRNSLLKMFFCRKALTTHRSLLITQCQTFLLLSTNQTLVLKWTKIA